MSARCFCARMPDEHDYVPTACTHHEVAPIARIVTVALSPDEAFHLKWGGCPWAGPREGGGFSRCKKLRGHQGLHTYEEKMT